ncbi:hypothetical protein CHS0354_038057 [Potamilus streckersoni]|uniref:Potassium channel subfamily K member 9 n=1 Tax=Potamilus streckersoni TaxID=2493646 RepID=A0AAE0SSV0_9BIVA|nr:hypothetical protein CHS0354_038057 [Potamilus streckersoni]
MARTQGRKGCCFALHLHEDNARFILLFFVMITYMLAGAGLFMVLEKDNEDKEKAFYKQSLEEFYEKYPSLNKSDLEYILKIHSEAESAGFVGNKRPRWDFSGSFYFVGTVVSTIALMERKPCYNGAKYKHDYEIFILFLALHFASPVLLNFEYNSMYG